MVPTEKWFIIYGDEWGRKSEISLLKKGFSEYKNKQFIDKRYPYLWLRQSNFFGFTLVCGSDVS